MFQLLTKTFPENAGELQRLLNESLREVFVTKSEPVRVLDKSYPALREIRIDLDGAATRPNLKKPHMAIGETSQALTAGKLALRGERIAIGPASVKLSLDARDVHLNRGLDSDGDIVLGVERASDGKVEIAIVKSDLEAAITELAKREAGKHGVTIEDATLTFQELSPRELEVVTSVRARKLFFATTIKLTGKLAVDDDLSASVSELTCSGDGAIGSLACGFLAPHLEKLNGRAFPLMAISLGEVRLSDVQLSAGKELSVRAQFSS